MSYQVILPKSVQKEQESTEFPAASVAAGSQSLPISLAPAFSRVFARR